MIFYVNGAEHTSAARAANQYVFAQDDPRFIYMGKAPHPENLPVGFARQLKMALNTSIQNDAMPLASNDRILRKSKEFINKPHDQEIFLLIMWAPWDRKEIKFGDDFYQITTSDLELPTALRKSHKKFVNQFDADIAQELWHNDIWEFHNDLVDRGIKHLFGLESDCFDLIKQKYEWGDNFINPYNKEDTFVRVCGEHNSPDGDGFFFEKAHTSYMKYLIPKCLKILT